MALVLGQVGASRASIQKANSAEREVDSLSTSATLPENAARVLARAGSAMGGEHAVDALVNIDTYAQGDGPNGPFQTRIQSSVDGRMRFEQTTSDGSRYLMGIDQTAWSYDRDTARISNVDTRTAAFLRGHELHMLVLAPETRLSLSDTRSGASQSTGMVSADSFNGHESVVVQFLDSMDAPVRIHYSARSHLPMGIELTGYTSEGPSRISVVLDRWRMVGNLLLFTAATFEQDDDMYTYTYTDIAPNAVPEQLFDRSNAPPDAPLVRLTERLRLERLAHLSYDVDLFLSLFRDPFIQISSGQVQFPAHEQLASRFQRYFDSVTFLEWNDLNPPMVSLSVDGSLATVIVHKRVHLSASGGTGAPVEEKAVFAWMESWKNNSGTWVMTANASTERSAAIDSGGTSSPLVRLSDYAPEIEIDPRYFSENTFIGRRIDGYEAPEAMLSRSAADALKEAAAIASKREYALLIYDAYRPQRAVDDFVQWGTNLQDTLMKDQYYPGVPKAELFKRGYIAERSGHSRAATVDLTLMRDGVPVDMGTPFDFFDERSHTEHPDIDEGAMANRIALREIMEAAGFRNYTKEWWHYTLVDEPYPATYFDQPVR